MRRDGRLYRFVAAYAAASLFASILLAPATAFAAYISEDSSLSEVFSHSQEDMTDVGIYLLWTATTGKKYPGLDGTQDIYSDDNLAAVRQFNSDLRDFNASHGNCNDRMFYEPDSVDDLSFTDDYSSLQYDDLRDYVGTFVNAQVINGTANMRGAMEVQVDGLGIGTKMMMQGFAKSSDAVTFGQVANDTNTFDKIVYGVTPAHQFEYNGKTYQICWTQEIFDEMQKLVAGEEVAIKSGNKGTIYKRFGDGSYPMFYTAFPTDTASWNHFQNYNLVIANDSTGVGAMNELSQLTPQQFTINANGLTPYRAYCTCYGFGNGLNHGSLRISEGHNYDPMNIDVGYGMILIPITFGTSYTSGGGGATPSDPTNIYIRIPTPLLSIDDHSVTVNEDNSITTVNGDTINQGDYYYDESSHEYYYDNSTSADYYDNSTNYITNNNYGNGSGQEVYDDGLIVTWLQNIYSAIIGIPQDIEYWGSLIVEGISRIGRRAIGTPDITIDTGFDLDQFKLELGEIFPFVMFNFIAQLVGGLAHDPITPEFDLPVPVLTSSGTIDASSSIEIDLHELDGTMEIVRGLEYYFSAICLAFLCVKFANMFGGSLPLSDESDDGGIAIELGGGD